MSLIQRIDALLPLGASSKVVPSVSGPRLDALQAVAGHVRG